MEQNEDRLVATIGGTFVKNIVDWKAKEEETLQRRTLHMRTGQLLQARRHTPFDEAVTRIYQDIFTPEDEIISLELPKK